jgi:hypothetical protein
MWSAIIPAVAGIGSALLGSRASSRAADTQAAALDRSADIQRQSNLESLAFLREGRDMARADLAPYRDAGLADYNAFRGAVGTSFQESPGYRFAFDEGVNAVDRAASARGMLNSGARLRELTRFGQGMANQEYGNWMNRLQGLAGVGQTATGQSASLAQGAASQGAGMMQQAGQNIANTTAQAGAANAAGQVNSTNALMGGLNQGFGLYSLMNPGWGNVSGKGG